MEDSKPIGFLFESIAIYDESSVETFLDKMNRDQASYVILQAIYMAHSKGIYSLQESEILSKAIRLINKTPTE
jgi:hypothetical protein